MAWVDEDKVEPTKGGRWVDAPEEKEQGPSTEATDLRHQFYRGALPLPEKAINAIEAWGNAHDPLNPHGDYAEELTKVEERQNALQKERPVGSAVAKIAGAASPGAGLIKGAQNALGAGRLAQYGGAALGSAIQGGAQEGPQGAAFGAAGGLAGQGLVEGLGALAKKFPWIADRLAERMTGQTAKQAATRIKGTVAGNFPEGDYAENVLKMGLNKLTPGGAVKAAEGQMNKAGGALGAMREGLTVSPEEVSQAIGSHPALDDLREALQLGKGSTIAGQPLSNLPPEILARNPQLAQLAQQGGAGISLSDLAEKTNENVLNPLNQALLKATSSQGPLVSPSYIRALQTAKNNLNALQESKILGKGVEPGAYDAARKAYAIASGVNRGEAKTAGQQAVRRGIGAMVGLIAGHPFIGAAVGDRPLAWGALKAYQAARSAPAQALAKAARVATPGVAQAVARAAASGEPAQAGAAIQKAQANDPSAREPEE